MTLDIFIFLLMCLAAVFILMIVVYKALVIWDTMVQARKRNDNKRMAKAILKKQIKKFNQ